MCLHRLLIAKIGIYHDLFVDLFAKFTICSDCGCKVASECVLCGVEFLEYSKGFHSLMNHLEIHTNTGIEIIGTEFVFGSNMGRIRAANLIKLHPQILLVKSSCRTKDGEQFRMKTRKITVKCGYRAISPDNCRCGDKIIKHMTTYRASCFICDMEFDCFPSIEVVVNHISNCIAGQLAR